VGTGSHLLRALTLLAAALAAGCLDFIEPEIPEMGAPAVLQATVRLTDRGEVTVEARLEPGLDGAGFRRRVDDPALTVLGRVLVPDTVLRNGARVWDTQWQASPDIVASEVRLASPAVASIGATPPSVAWLGLRAVGPDTIRLARGVDLLLPLVLTPGAPQPLPQIRQWFLRLAGRSGAFNVSADGPPPDTIFIPARWIPAGDSLEVRLIFNQSSVLHDPPGDYIGLITLDTRLFWTLLLHAAGTRP
jgi:hypothetical protein